MSFAPLSGTRVVDVTTQQPSPYARSLLFGYVAQFVYEGDSPIAERRAAALALDQGLLAELLGRAELRELLDPEVLAEVESMLQRTLPERRARDAVRRAGRGAVAPASGRRRATALRGRRFRIRGSALPARAWRATGSTRAGPAAARAVARRRVVLFELRSSKDSE